MIVGALQRHRTQHALEGLGAPTRVARRLPARARHRRPCVIRGVSVEPALDGAGRHAQRLSTRGRLNGFEIPVVGCAVAYERVDLMRNLRLERRTEPPFSRRSAAVSVTRSISASANRSQAPQYSSVASRN